MASLACVGPLAALACLRCIKRHVVCTWTRDTEEHACRYIQDDAEDTQELDDKMRRFRSCFEGFKPDLVDFVVRAWGSAVFALPHCLASLLCC